MGQGGLTGLRGLALAAVVAGPAFGQGGPAAVVVDEVRLERVQEHRRVTGELVALRRAMVATREQGLITEIPVRAGRRIHAGEIVARLDSRRLELAHAQAAADREAIQSIIEERLAEETWRRRELELYRQSAERGAAGVKELLDAESALNIASARVRQAQGQQAVNAARLDLVAQRLADTTIVAPFDGVVVSRQTELGEWVGEGDALIELVSMGTIEAWLDVPQRFFDAVVSADVAISIRIDASGEAMPAEELRVVPLMDPRARSFQLVATLDDRGGRLAPGMSLTAWIPAGATAERLTVPRDAVMFGDAGAYVYVARGGGGGPAQASPVGLRVLFPADGRVVVETTDLQPGDLVVVEGNERLFPMMPVLPSRQPAAEGGGR